MNDPYVIKPDDLPTCGRWVDFRPGCRTHATSVRASFEEIARFTANFGEDLARLMFGCAVHRRPLDYIGAEPKEAAPCTTAHQHPALGSSARPAPETSWVDRYTEAERAIFGVIALRRP